jgi:hypothetical protein
MLGWLYEILGYYSSEDVIAGLLGCNALWAGE